MPIIALIDEVVQRLAGVLRVIDVDSYPPTIVDILLQNLTRHP